MKRKLKLLDLSLIGIGLIIGAGVYALIGESAILAGQGLPLSLVIGGLVAAFSALSLAELASAYPLDSSVYEYCEQAFNSKTLGFVCAWALVFSAVVLVSTVAIGFGDYLFEITHLPPLAGAFLILSFLTIINILGVEITAWTNALIAFLETGGLILIIILGFWVGGELKGEVPDFNSVMEGAALAFFAFTGFEAIILASEEVEEPEKNIPRALLISLTVTTILYVLVGFSVLKLATPEQIRDAPLAVVAEIAMGPIGKTLLSIIAFLSLGNTILLGIFEISRMMYGLAEEKAIPHFFLELNKFDVPQNAILTSMILAVLFTLGGIIFTAEMANFLLLFVLAVCNLAVIALRFKKEDKSTFKVPDVLGFPLPALIGFLSCISLAAFIGRIQILVGVGVLATGFIIHFVKSHWKE